ncbi:MAG: NrfD/PsrC family molybdoenzyme membrane anchor subunit [Acidobacteriota bacterium]
MSSHAAAPVRRPLLTPGVLVLLALMAVGFACALARFLFGLGAVTHLDNQYPWGIWIAIDVATGVALAAGGFTAAALVHVFHRRRYESVTRSALLTALLGYTFVVLGILVDLGRYYNIWHPIVPAMWSGHSALFEVAMCVMAYLTVLYLEFMPIVVERFAGRVRLPGPVRLLDRFVEGALRLFDRTLSRVMWVFIILGVVLSTLHQSSLGTLMLLAPHKMHPLWWTPILPLLFFLSALAVGFPMVIFESLAAARAFRREPEMDVLAPLARIIPVLLFVYLAFKVGDIAIRGAVHLLLDGSTAALMFLLEVGLGVLLPLLMLLSSRVRRSPMLLFSAATLVVLGVAFNRINVFLTAYTPVYKLTTYFPSVGEIAVTVGLIAGLLFVYRVLVTVFPVLPGEGHAGEERARDRRVIGAPLPGGG